MNKMNLFKINLFLFFIAVCGQAFSSDRCFIAKEKGQILISEGDCSTAYGPQSTFKIALSLIGFDSGILKNENSPSWTIPIGADPYIDICKNDHNPRTWMRDSCVWYSRVLTNKLGMKKFQDYINDFSYGNKDLSGGLDNAWLSSSLKISPEEQILFLQNMIDEKFSISKTSYDKTKKIMFIQELPGGWKLYGKTGTALKVSNEIGRGWFIGYIEKNNRQIVFATHIIDNEKTSILPSLKARNEAFIKIWDIIKDLEKQS